MSGDFDWYGDNAGDVVVREQASIAVYSNPNSEVVIRRKADWDEDGDVWIVVAPDRARALCESIMRVAADLLGEVTTLQISPPKPNGRDRTAAERQRRHRDKLRDSHGGERDVDRDGDQMIFAPEVADLG